MNSFGMLFAVEGIETSPDKGEFGLHVGGGADRALREARKVQPGQEVLPVCFRQEGGDRLADGRAMHRSPLPDRGMKADRMIAFNLVEIDDLTVDERREMNRLADRLAEIPNGGMRRGANVGFLEAAASHLDESHSRHEATLARPMGDETLRYEHRDDAVQGASRQPGLFAEFRKAGRARGEGDGAKDVEALFQGRRPVLPRGCLCLRDLDTDIGLVSTVHNVKH